MVNGPRVTNPEGENAHTQMTPAGLLCPVTTKIGNKTLANSADVDVPICQLTSACVAAKKLWNTL